MGKLTSSANNRTNRPPNVNRNWVTTLVNTFTLTPADANTSTTSSPTCNTLPRRFLLEALPLSAVEQQLRLPSSSDCQHFSLEHTPSFCTAKSIALRSISPRLRWELHKSKARKARFRILQVTACNIQ